MSRSPEETIDRLRIDDVDRISIQATSAEAPHPPASKALPPTRRRAAESDVESVFPLPLSPLEKYLVWDDREECPMTSFIELHFAGQLHLAGQLNVQAMCDALTHTSVRHPLLASRLTQTVSGLQWDYDPSFQSQLRDPDFDTPLIDYPGCYQTSPRPIDLFDEPGCRSWYQASEDGSASRLLIQLHHACCDGVGLRQVLIDALSAYAKTVGEGRAMNAPDSDDNGQTPTKRRRAGRRSLQPDRLRGRFDFRAIKSKPVAQPLSAWDKIRNAVYFHFQRPATLARPSRSSATVPTACDQPLLHHVFDAPRRNVFKWHVEIDPSQSMTWRWHCCSKSVGGGTKLMARRMRHRGCAY